MLEDEISSALQQTVRAASLLGSNDLAFHRSLDAKFSVSLDTCLQKLIGITNSLLQFSCETDAPTLEDKDSVESRWGDVIDVVDSLLERTDSSLEELVSKAKKAKEEAAALQQSAKSEKPPLPANLRNAQDLPHPQLKFHRKPDNTDAPWTPLITHKLNAQVGLEESVAKVREVDGISKASHPYTYEIENIEYPNFVFQEAKPIEYKDMDSTEATWVDTPERLAAMLTELRQSREIAIDLEHHDFHSFRGFVCLMQISNREQDWIVDTLVLRDELQVLNEVFTDPTILKVLHGANSDVIWLQRDFGLYLVNLFDTYHASKALGLGSFGLAFLLQKYVHFEADKRYQLADWRIRPLPKEMLYYARSDTHYLLYVYDLMRNELLQKSNPGTHSAMASVLQASAEVSLRTYVKEPYDAAQGQGSDGWQFLLNRFYGTRAFSAQQLEILKALHQWRDLKAREKDESTRFIMPNSAIVTIAAAMPKDLNSLLQSAKQVSSTMQANLKPILKVIQLAIKASQDQPAQIPAGGAGIPLEIQTQTMSQTKPVTRSLMSESIPFGDPVHSHSSFWGTLVPELQSDISASPLVDLRLSVPLPPLEDDIFVTSQQATPNLAEEQSQDVTKEAQPDEVFVVRDIGRRETAKRKSEVIDLDLDASATEAAQAKREARKKAKQAKKDGKAVDTTSKPAEDEAFDYAAQPSLLQERELKKTKYKKFGEFQGKIVRSKQVQGGKQTTFKK